jgi:hypothetical protein
VIINISDKGNKTVQNNNEYSEKRIGEILIDFKLATQNDILTAVATAKKELSKTGTVLVNMGIITLAQLKDVLKLQLGYDVVTEEQISSITPETISILPEDFIKMYQVIPISCDGKNLIVGMVNPNDKTVIANIIAYTGGLNPVRLILTLYEFKELIQRLYNSEMKTNVINDNIRKIDL